MRYIAMLRGVNVGPHNRISMSKLKAICEKLNMARVVTYLQSGNIVFDSKPDIVQGLKQQMETFLEKEAACQTYIIIKIADELNKIVINNPFMTRRGIDQTKLHITFLDMPPVNANSPIQIPTADEWELRGDVIYLYCPNGYGRTKLTNGFFERKLKVNATTRNWKTVLALQKLANN